MATKTITFTVDSAKAANIIDTLARKYGWTDALGQESGLTQWQFVEDSIKSMVKADYQEQAYKDAEEAAAAIVQQAFSANDIT